MKCSRHISHCAASLVVALLLMLVSCSTTRHVPEGSYLLNSVSIAVDDSIHDITGEQLMPYLRQQPNHKTLWSAKIRLGIYNMSGKDSTRWWNRWLRSMGEAPVIFDGALTDQSVEQLRRTVMNKGYLNAQVEVDTVLNTRKKKADVRYRVSPGKPYIISSVRYDIENDTIARILRADSSRFIIKPGDVLDRSWLDVQRELFNNKLRNLGYYTFSKDLISFSADTTAGSRDVDLTVYVGRPVNMPASPSSMLLKPYYIHSVKVITDYDPVIMAGSTEVPDDCVPVKAGDIEIYYGNKRWLRPSVIAENCFLTPGKRFSLSDADHTCEAFARLGILKFINIHYQPIAGIGDMGLMDVYILLTPDKAQSLSFEIEGTNSEGDLGVAAAISYQHRNIGHGSEIFSAKVRGAYESLSGDLEGLINNRYLEYSADLGVSVPKFQFPLLPARFKRKIKASTEYNASINYQERPEYTRIISTVGWSYRWVERSGRRRHTVTPVDINYVYLPKSTNSFLDDIAPDNPLLRYSYEDHFIMRLGYSFYYTNKRAESPWHRNPQTDVSTVRINVETAGNLLWAINSVVNHRANYREDPYKVLGIRYSQYLKGEVEYAAMHRFSPRHTLAWRAAFGIAYPYGNSTILPFEKRFYGGGANGVRGWDVRTLGPGCYNATNSVSDFINQCGDIRLIGSLEYRFKLFWLFEGAAFIDIGNIWTIHSYSNQPGGMFHFNSFFKQLAASYGVGIRMDFKYFLIRFDMGMKGHNPAKDADHWPLIHPRWHRDSSFHFSIGYPF